MKDDVNSIIIRNHFFIMKFLIIKLPFRSENQIYTESLQLYK